nr:Mu-like prophage I protein [uncultured bacterium]
MELQLALNSLESGHEVLALNFELTAGATPPAEMMLIPPGNQVTGRDGRSWKNPDPPAIIRFFQERGLKIPIDIEHATELKAPHGEPAPAMAWGTELEAKPDGSVWAKTEWTPKGAEMVMNKEYSYYSPAIIFDKGTMNIIGIKSVGLTNTPNFDIPALNRADTQKEAHMNLATLLAALGLASTATFEEALNHIGKLKGDLTVALNHADSPPLDKFVPRADYDTALNRATSAETSLKTITEQQLETAINSEIDAALAAGKITPATKEYHIAACREAGGLERFKTFVGAAPVVADASNLDKKKFGDEATALNAEEKSVCVALGISEEDYIKANK